MFARTLSLASLLALVACGHSVDKPTDLDALDRELTTDNAAQRDPAVLAALHDQIMVDPGLTQSSNANAVRPPSRPDSGAIPPDPAAPRADPVDPAKLRHAPAAGTCAECTAAQGALTLGALAGRQRDGSARRCAGAVAYSAAWANRLPADLPLYPDARVVEAAGNDRDGCALRVVSFASSAAPAKLVDWYYTRATAAGYSAGHGSDGHQNVVAGTRGADAYTVYVTPRAGGGGDVDLVTNAGR